jgi:hypothetical protein
LGDHLVREREAHDLSRNREFASFGFLGYRTSAGAVEFVALCDADGLTEGDIVRLRDEFFDLVRRLPRDYGLKPAGRNPNGLLGLVFADGCPEPMARFIARQTRISHTVGTGGVSVSWAIDVPARRIHTHDNPVSIFPPVIIAARSVYPGLDYLQSLLGPALMAPSPAGPPDPIHRTPKGPSMPEPSSSVPAAPETTGHPAPQAPTREDTVAGGNASARPGPAHILFLAADPTLSRLDLERELERIETNLRMAKERDRLHLKAVWAASFDRLSQAMLDDSPTIVHFAGHGTEEGIVLRGEAGEARVVTIPALAELFSLFHDTIRCVVLNACWSEPQARAIREHIPHVIGMRAEIPDATAIAFSTGFYQAIAAGRDVPFAYRMGIAHARDKGDGHVDLITLL